MYLEPLILIVLGVRIVKRLQDTILLECSQKMHLKFIFIEMIEYFLLYFQTSDSPGMAQLYSNTLESSPSPSQIGQPLVPGLEMIKRAPSPAPINPPPAHSGKYNQPFPSAQW